MGMQATQIQSPQTNRPMGKGSFQHSDGLPHGDYGDPNFRGSNVENMPDELTPFGRNIVEVGGMNGRPQQATQSIGKGGLSQGLLNGTTPGNLGNQNNPEYGNAPPGPTNVVMQNGGLQPNFAQGGEDMPVPAGGINGHPQQATQPIGKGGNVTYPGQGGQPRVGQPNNYSNTVGPWDNASIGTQNPFQRSGKGKGA